MTAPLANREIVVYALYTLGGATTRCHTEDIALKCFDLVPSAFSWAKHPQYPDKDIVRVALTDARKEQHGALVDGRAGQSRGQFQKTHRSPTADGWTLTDAGIEWAERNRNRFQSLSAAAEPKEHRQKALQFLKRVKEHKVFEQYRDRPDGFHPAIGELAEMLRCRVDADDAVWRDRFDRIRKSAVATGQNEVVGFVEQSMRAYEEQR